MFHVAPSYAGAVTAQAPGDAPPPSDAPFPVEILPPADAPSPQVRQLWRRRVIADWCTGVSVYAVFQVAMLYFIPSAFRDPWYPVACVIVVFVCAASVTLRKVTSSAIKQLDAQERVPQRIHSTDRGLADLAGLLVLQFTGLCFLGSVALVVQTAMLGSSPDRSTVTRSWVEGVGIGRSVMIEFPTSQGPVVSDLPEYSRAAPPGIPLVYAAETPKRVMSEAKWAEYRSRLWLPWASLALCSLLAGAWYAKERRRARKQGDLRHHIALTRVELKGTVQGVPHIRVTFADGKRVVYLGNPYLRRVLRSRMAHAQLPIPDWLAPELDAEAPLLNRFGVKLRR